MTQSQISIGKRSEALREVVGLSWSPTERLLHESQLIAARSRLNEQTWEAAFAEGQAMTLKDAVEYALAEDGHDPSTAPVPERSLAVESMGNLTRREQEVATPVARGLTNRQISADLSTSERTAANHVAKILRKLGLRSRAQIAARVGVIVEAAEAKSRTEPGMRASDA